MVTLAVQEMQEGAPHADGKERARPHALWPRIGGLLVLVTAAVLVLVSFLNYSNYRKTYLDLNHTRYLALAKDVRQTIVAALNIGLRPSEDGHLQPALAEMARRYPGIRYIGVIDEAGRLLGHGPLPRQLDGRWKDRIAATDAGSYWQARSADTFLVGLPFVNNFGMKVGAVIIGYDRKPIEASIGDMRRRIAFDVARVLLLAALLTMAGVYLLTRRLANDLSQVGATIEDTLGAAAPPLIDGHLLGEDVARDINEFTTVSHGLARRLAALEQTLKQEREQEAGKPASGEGA